MTNSAVERIRSQGQALAIQRHEHDIEKAEQYRLFREEKDKRLAPLHGIARHDHELRFNPLQNILDFLEVDSIFQEYFPKSARLVTDQYQNKYHDGITHLGNVYLRSVTICKDFGKDLAGFITIVAAAVEPPTEFLSTARTKYSVWILEQSAEYTYNRTAREDLEKVFFNQNNGTKLVTPVDDLYEIDKLGEKILFPPYKARPLFMTFGAANNKMKHHIYSEREIPFKRDSSMKKGFEEVIVGLVRGIEYNRLYPQK